MKFGASATRTMIIAVTHPLGLAHMPKLQVLGAVIIALPVLVVNQLVRFKVAAKDLLHHKAMLLHHTSAICPRVIRGIDLHISKAVLVAATFPIRVFVSAAWTRAMLHEIELPIFGVGIFRGSLGSKPSSEALTTATSTKRFGCSPLDLPSPAAKNSSLLGVAGFIANGVIAVKGLRDNQLTASTGADRTQIGRHELHLLGVV
ncbi:MAG: hypothetical protein MUQ56_10190 [Thermoleophilia bacterium]|nr:hypothetical protein [Thermoleophilia bacterium]